MIKPKGDKKNITLDPWKAFAFFGAPKGTRPSFLSLFISILKLSV